MRLRHSPILVTVVAAGALSLLVAACGGSSPSPSGSASASSSSGQPSQAQIQREQQDAVRFSDCMRSHGVSNFPDPNTDPHAFKESLDPSTTHAPGFGSAVDACQHLLPNGGHPNSQSQQRTRAQTAALLAFARCLRSHGFQNFPDPSSSGEVTHQMVAAAGINLSQPAVRQAGYACTNVTHGVITRAVVARFLAGR
jgi:hypothetical protein